MARTCPAHHGVVVAQQCNAAADPAAVEDDDHEKGGHLQKRLHNFIGLRQSRLCAALCSPETLTLTDRWDRDGQMPQQEAGVASRAAP